LVKQRQNRLGKLGNSRSIQNLCGARKAVKSAVAVEPQQSTRQGLLLLLGVRPARCDAEQSHRREHFHFFSALRAVSQDLDQIHITHSEDSLVKVTRCR
jgi:hypothetical protein